MLKIDNLHAFYGKSHVLHGVHFDVRDAFAAQRVGGSLLANARC